MIMAYFSRPYHLHVLLARTQKNNRDHAFAPARQTRFPRLDSNIFCRRNLLAADLAFKSTGQVIVYRCDGDG